MSRKFSLAYLTIPGTAPVDQIRIAKEAGYDFVSLRTIPMHLPGEPEFLLHKDAKLFEETRQALKEYDMPVMDIELARVRPDLDINEYDPAFEKAGRHRRAGQHLDPGQGLLHRSGGQDRRDGQEVRPEV